MVREFRYAGKTPEELKAMTTEDFIAIAPSRIRRTLKRGLSDKQKKLLERKVMQKTIQTTLVQMIFLVLVGLMLHSI